MVVNGFELTAGARWILVNHRRRLLPPLDMRTIITVPSTAKPSTSTHIEVHHVDGLKRDCVDRSQPDESYTSEPPPGLFGYTGAYAFVAVIPAVLSEPTVP